MTFEIFTLESFIWYILGCGSVLVFVPYFIKSDNVVDCKKMIRFFGIPLLGIGMILSMVFL